MKEKDKGKDIKKKEGNMQGKNEENDNGQERRKDMRENEGNQ